MMNALLMYEVCIMEATTVVPYYLPHGRSQMAFSGIPVPTNTHLTDNATKILSAKTNSYLLRGLHEVVVLLLMSVP